MGRQTPIYIVEGWSVWFWPLAVKIPCRRAAYCPLCSPTPDVRRVGRWWIGHSDARATRRPFDDAELRTLLFFSLPSDAAPTIPAVQQLTLVTDLFPYLFLIHSCDVSQSFISPIYFPIHFTGWDVTFKIWWADANLFFLDNGNEFWHLQSVYSQKIITKQNHLLANWGKIKRKKI